MKTQTIILFLLLFFLSKGIAQDKVVKENKNFFKSSILNTLGWAADTKELLLAFYFALRY